MTTTTKQPTISEGAIYSPRPYAIKRIAAAYLHRPKVRRFVNAVVRRLTSGERRKTIVLSKELATIAEISDPAAFMAAIAKGWGAMTPKQHTALSLHFLDDVCKLSREIGQATRGKHKQYPHPLILVKWMYAVAYQTKP
ncbi:MAG: hypothetical protein ABIH03_00235, partial [Pseudomonadota bacterium]